MTTNDFLFGTLPYVVVVLAVVITVMRWKLHQFTVSSLSSQLLESRKLYWGSVPFHWGLSIILLAHVLALIIPRGFEIWNGAPLRLYILEITGLALGFWTLFGVGALIYRRYSEPKIRRVTTPSDVLVLAVVATQIVTGVWIALGYRWGSYWGTAVFVPYIRSLLTMQPNPDMVVALPWVLKAHVLSFFAFLAIFPFTRLVHIITLPLQYFFRPWQKVIANRTPPQLDYEPNETGGSRAPVVVAYDRDQ